MHGTLPRILGSLLLHIVLLFCVWVAANIPNLYAEEGLPLFPALLFGQAVLVCGALCLCGLYAINQKTALGRRRLAGSGNASDDLPWAHNRQWVAKRVRHAGCGIAGAQTESYRALRPGAAGMGVELAAAAGELLQYVP
jgi:hypothetical protein